MEILLRQRSIERFALSYLSVYLDLRYTSSASADFRRKSLWFAARRCGKTCGVRVRRYANKEARIRKLLVSARIDRYLPNVRSTTTGKYRKFVVRRLALRDACGDRILRRFSFPAVEKPGILHARSKGLQTLVEYLPRASSLPLLRRRNHHFIGDLGVFVPRERLQIRKSSRPSMSGKSSDVTEV